MTRQQRRNDQDRDPQRARVMPGVDASPFTPESLQIGARQLQVGTGWVATFAVIGYPREVGPGWLAPLLAYPGRVDVSVHIEPVDPTIAAARLRSQLAKLESGRRHGAEHGRLHDPHVEAATEDAYDLSARVARGEGKLFRLGLYLAVHADTEPQLGDEVAAVRSLAASLLLDARPTTYRALPGWTTTLPLGMDGIRMRRTVDTEALSAAFPFQSPDLPSPGPAHGVAQGAAGGAGVAGAVGVLYGYNLGSAGLVHWDRFAPSMHNHNSVILARSGAGKSYLAKLELLRCLHRGIHAAVIDPDDEYTRLAAAVGARIIHLGRMRGPAQPVRPAPAHPSRRAPHRPPRCPDPAQPVPAHRPRRPPRRPHGHRAGRLGPRHHRCLPGGRASIPTRAPGPGPPPPCAPCATSSPAHPRPGPLPTAKARSRRGWRPGCTRSSTAPSTACSTDPPAPPPAGT